MVDEQKLRELAGAATPGHWTMQHIGRNEWGAEVWTMNNEEIGHSEIAETYTSENAAYMAAANPATTLALLDELQTLRSERTAWRVTAENAEAALEASRAAVPAGMVLAPIELLKRAESSLGSFCSDHGWGDADMQTMDDLSGLLAAAPQPVAQPGEPVKWNSPEDTANAPGLVWLREKGAIFLGYHFEQPFREYRDADGFYVGQQDAESYWARHEDAEPCNPDGWCQLLPPMPTSQAKPEQAAQQWQPIETAPRDMGAYLFLCTGVAVQGFRDATGVLCVCQEDGGKQWRNMRRKPTHWMPLPASPKPKD